MCVVCTVHYSSQIYIMYCAAVAIAASYCCYFLFIMCRATIKALTNAPSCSGSDAPKASLCSIVDIASSKLICRVAEYSSDAEKQFTVTLSAHALLLQRRLRRGKRSGVVAAVRERQSQTSLRQKLRMTVLAAQMAASAILYTKQ